MRVASAEWTDEGSQNSYLLSSCQPLLLPAVAAAAVGALPWKRKDIAGAVAVEIVVAVHCTDDAQRQTPLLLAIITILTKRAKTI